MISAGAIKNSVRAELLFGWLADTHRRALAFLFLFSLVCFLPGLFSLPPVDRDESRFAQASKQMLETGDYVDIRFQETARHKKPVGIYWLQTAAVKAAETVGVSNARANIAVYRLPSLIGAIGVVLLTYWSALVFVSRRYALIAGLFMAGSVLLGVEARLAKTDAVLALTAVAAMGALARIYMMSMKTRGLPKMNGWLVAGIFWTAVAGAALLKGPVIPFFIALAIVSLMILDRSTRLFFNLKPLAGILWTLVIVLPWFLAVMFKTSGAFMQESMGQDLIGKLFSGQESHGAPPGFYWLLFWVTFWPVAPLAAMATDFAWNERLQTSVRFLAAWIVPAWIVLEAVATKLPHYVLPLYPAIAILIALALEKRAELSRLASATLALWPAGAVAFGAAALVVSYRFGGSASLWLWLFVAFAILCAVAAFMLFREGLRERGLALAIASSVLTTFALYTSLPNASSLFLSPRIFEAAKAANCGTPQIASAGFNEPSLVFLGGTNVKFIGGEGAARHLRETGCRVAVVAAKELPAFQSTAKTLGVRAQEIGRVKGLNYSDGREADVIVFTAAKAGAR